MVELEKPGRDSPSAHLLGHTDDKPNTARVIGRGRRTVQELMTSNPSASLPNESLFHGSKMGVENHDVEKINFVRMLLALKMVKTDGEATPLPGMDNKLFLGSIGAAYNKTTLQKNKITHILCLCDGTRERFEKDYKYFTCVAEDAPSFDIALKFIPCSDFIDDAIKGGGRILVHCFQGKSRCTAIAMSYLMLRKGLGFDEAIKACRKARAGAEPNLGFVAQLKALDRSLRRNRFTENKKIELKELSPSKSKGGPNESAGPMSLSDLKETKGKGAVSMAPKFSLHAVNQRNKFLNSSKLTLSFGESGNIVIQEKKEPVDPEEVARINAENKRIASGAAMRLYKSAMSQQKKADNMRGTLSPEYTFKPVINNTSHQHAMIAKARGRDDHGYMAETDAFVRLKEARLRKAEVMEERLEELHKKLGSSRFHGFGSIFYDTEEGSPRDLGRTSPTEEFYDYMPLVNKSTEETRERLKDPNRISKATASSTIGEKIAKRKKEFIEEKGGRGVRDRMSASGLLVNFDEAEALYISEVRLAKLKEKEKADIKSKMVAATHSGTRSVSAGVSPPRQRLKNIMKASGSPEIGDGSEEVEGEEKVMKDTLSSFLRRTNAKNRRDEIEEARGDKKAGYLNDRFRSPGGILYNIEHSANIDVAHWQYSENEEPANGNNYKKVITDKEEKERNELRIKMMYEEGLKHYNEREVLRRNAPIEKECTFSPTFFTKGLREEGVAFGKGLSERGAAASKMLMNTSMRSTSNFGGSPNKTPKKKVGVGGMGSPAPRVVSLKELREESSRGEGEGEKALKAKKAPKREKAVKLEEREKKVNMEVEEKEVEIQEETKKQLEGLEKEDLLQVVQQLTRRESDLTKMEEYLHTKLQIREEGGEGGGGREEKTTQQEPGTPKGAKTPNTPMFMSAPGSPASDEDFALNPEEEEELRRLEEEEQKERKMSAQKEEEGGGGGKAEKGGRGHAAVDAAEDVFREMF
ncbi:hypothetical protein TrRE_jg677 [Triparma retinervis]|uniref:Uncharacterized protein n=1 Tax=Triparma retinervis TaxID=2557542 RepID=A0A9W7E6B7_9STRA|nr:hypothetical protein TrRE_jg677 [Triparma retinervis]